MRDFHIPVYRGSYDMGHDATQAHLDGVRWEIMTLVLGKARLAEIQASTHAAYEERHGCYAPHQVVQHAQIGALLLAIPPQPTDRQLLALLEVWDNGCRELAASNL